MENEALMWSSFNDVTGSQGFRDDSILSLIPMIIIVGEGHKLFKTM